MISTKRCLRNYCVSINGMISLSIVIDGRCTMERIIVQWNVSSIVAVQWNVSYGRIVGGMEHLCLTMMNHRFTYNSVP